MSHCRPRGRSIRSSGLWSSPWQSSSKGSASLRNRSPVTASAGETRSATQRRIREFLERTWIQVALFLLLSYVLFVNNIATIAEASDDSILAINISLIIAFSLFCLEMSLNFWTASKQDYLYMSMELIGTFSILLEVSWIATWLGLNHSIERESVSKTAIITSRAGRVTRMVRLIRFVRALKIFIMIRRYFARKIDDGGKERSMAPSSIGNCLNDRISLLAAFLVMLTMMVVSLLNPHDADEMNRAFMLILSIAGRDGSQESIDFMVQQIKKFIDGSDGGIVLRKLLVGELQWSWYEPGCCSNDRDIATLTRDGTPSVYMELDISEQNMTNAYLEILLGLAVIAELFVFVILLQRNTSQILIAPLERIFTTIKQNASVSETPKTKLTISEFASTDFIQRVMSLMYPSILTIFLSHLCTC